MKKIIALVLAAILAFSGFSFAAEKDFDTLNVGTYTPMTGYFFTDMWGASASDIDVRNLLHGYSLVTFDTTIGSFTANSSVVSGFVEKENDLKDHVYSIALYDDLKYSDGTPITAWDYAFAFLLMADPAISELGGNKKDLTYIKGAEEYRDGEEDVITGIHVRSDYMLDITISHEALPYFYELSYLDVTPYPTKLLTNGATVRDSGEGVSLSRKVDASVYKKTLFGEKGYISHPSVVSGPYTLESFDGEKAVFSANPYFKGDAEGNKPTFEKITFVTVTAENAAEKLASGEIDLINKATSAEATSNAMSLMGSGYSLSAYTRSGLSLISFCFDSPRIGYDSVRQALAMVMDKEGFTEAYVGDNGLVTEGYYGLGQWMYQVVTGSMAPPVQELDENATTAERKAYEKEQRQWGTLNLDKVKVWKGSTNNAESLLVRGGWNLNADGKKYDSAKDTVRARRNEDGELITLDMTLCCPEETGVAEALNEYFVKPAAEIGIKITVKEVAWDELLKLYYRSTERDCDMIYIATNFDAAFDPSTMFDPSDDAQGYANRTGVQDAKLYKYALAMRETEPGDTYTYCERWVAFQKRFAEVMPVIPIYTNVYFDFYTEYLRDYEISAYLGWPGAINKAYLSDAVETEEAEEEEEFIG